MAEIDIFEFGKQLIETGDLDPVYVVLHHANLTDIEMRFCLTAYWCFYDMGTVSWICRKPYGFWDRMEVAASSNDYPRGKERRHFRGANATKSVAWLKEKTIPGLFEIFDGAQISRKSLTLKEVLDIVQGWNGFGPWISFKVADMLERLDICKIEFDVDTPFLFDAPRQGAERLWGILRSGYDLPQNVETWAIEKILDKLGKLKAPPRFERRINMQEAETILCKWKSATNGHYHVGEDVFSLRKSLMRFWKCRTAQRFLQAGKGRIW